MASSLEKEDFYIRKTDGSNFTIWKQCMMDVLVNKGLAAPLKEPKEGVYKDDQWEELDARARAIIRLHLGEPIFFTIMDKTIAFELWDSLCSAWDGKNASNKVFLMKKLMRLSMKEGSSVSSHLNEFNSLYSQLTSKGLKFNDEMKAIFLLCSLLASWDTFNTAISNSTHGGKLAFSDVTSALLIEEIRCQSLDSGGHAIGSSTIRIYSTKSKNDRTIRYGLQHGTEGKIGEELQMLDEIRQRALSEQQVVHQRRKHWHDSKIKVKEFKKWNLVLLYQSRLGPKKPNLKIAWSGPFEVDCVFSSGIVRLKDLFGWLILVGVYNGAKIRLYYSAPNGPATEGNTVVLDYESRAELSLLVGDQ
ncbi:hypothetical protein L7F22_056270 [Adiantum nelumboides]|nr:hypothetical protein [Adiantum nelumboides]